MLRPSVLVVLLAAALVLSACDEEITPPDAIEAYYTLWGALDPLAETQAIRVVPIRPTIDPDTARTIDAAVTSTDLVSGVTTPWRDSVVTFADGSVGYVFLADLAVDYGGRYRFDVMRSDGKSTTAFTRTPPFVEPETQELQLPPGEARYPVLWPGAPQLNAIRIEYVLENGDCDRFPLVLPFEGSTEPFEFGWLTTVNLTEDAIRALAQLEGRRHAVVSITLSAEVAGTDWRPLGGVFDPEVLIEPGIFSNVQRGFGFVGGAYRTSVTWQPTAQALGRSQFEVPGFGGNCAQGPTTSDQ